jgi:23S rRNA A1618 N6-methylase RlmF
MNQRHFRRMASHSSESATQARWFCRLIRKGSNKLTCAIVLWAKEEFWNKAGIGI